MHDQIMRALHSSANDLGELRGELVMMSGEGDGQWGETKIWHFPRFGETRQRLPWKNELLDASLGVSIALSTTAGGLLGLLAVAFLFRTLSFIQKHTWQREQASGTVECCAAM